MRIWVVEVLTGDEWVMALPRYAYRTRVEARYIQASVRLSNEFVRTRIRAYERVENSK